MQKEQPDIHKNCHTYINICPSGLEKFASAAIQDELFSNNFSCVDLKILNDNGNINGSGASIKEGESSDIKEYKRQLYNQIQKKKVKQNAKRKRLGGAGICKEEEQQQQQSFDDVRDLHGVINMKHHGHNRFVSIGYYEDETIISTPGGLEGKKLITFQTNAPPKFVSRIRPMGCGPLLALVITHTCASQNNTYLATETARGTDSTDATKTRKNDTNGVFEFGKSLNESVSSFESFMLSEIGTINYKKSFENALDLWYHYVKDVWFESKDIIDFKLNQKGRMDAEVDGDQSHDDVNHIQVNDIKSLKESLNLKMTGNDTCRYRVSCIRSHTKYYSYNRDDIIPHLVKHLIPNELTMNDNIKESNGICDNHDRYDKTTPMKLAVDLKNYDFEVVLIIHEDSISIAISLCPYQYLGARSFSSGKIPPDITPPYITGEVSKTVVRLRPSIASLLCRMSCIEKGDLVLDPCVGVGSIPVEASLLGKNKTCYGLGGDIAICGSGGDDGSNGNDIINGGGLCNVVADYYKRVRDHQKLLSCTGGCDVMSWDASSIPIRDSTIDCIISDLPFGVRCMSASKLQMFLPLLFSECARLLRKRTGRMTLLCGASYRYALDAILQQGSYDDGYTKLFDIKSVFPVNIGGLTGWIIQATRNDVTAIKIKNYHDRRRKITMDREQQKRQGMKRRLQS